MCKIRMCFFLVLLFISSPLLAQSTLRYFGYYANNGTLAENYDHTNITQIGIWVGDRNQATSILLAELAAAKSRGVRALLSVDPFLFSHGGMGCPYSNEPMASQYWSTFVNQLILNGYLIPADPANSTVVAFYPVDEPDGCGLSDANGVANQALVNAVDTIRNNPNTANFPIATIMSSNYGTTVNGMRLFDWVGYDNYALDNNQYVASLNQFQSYLNLSRQRVILVPQAATGGGLDGSYHDPYQMFDYARSHASVIMLMPFLWSHGGWSGVRDIPVLREAYTYIGRQVKFGLFSQFVSQSVPSVMNAGQSYIVTIQYKNVGTAIWKAAEAVNLGSQSPRDNSIWGVSRVAVPGDINPGQTATFTFSVKAPSQTGLYNFQWGMVKDAVSWFGSYTPNIVVNVVTAPSGYISASPNPCTIYVGTSNCAVTINWSSNRADAEVWVSNADGSGLQLFARAQTGAQLANWIDANHKIFYLKSSGSTITSVDVYGVSSASQPPPKPNPCLTYRSGLLPVSCP